MTLLSPIIKCDLVKKRNFTLLLATTHKDSQVVIWLAVCLHTNCWVDWLGFCEEIMIFWI